MEATHDAVSSWVERFERGTRGIKGLHACGPQVRRLRAARDGSGRHPERRADDDTGGAHMTRRERAERRINRRMEWAESRDRKAAVALSAGDHLRDESGRMDWAFVSQPGHIPERARINRAMERGGMHQVEADKHRAKAAATKAALESTIFSDDPDAIEQLEAKAKGLLESAERMKAVNAAFRKAKGADSAAKLAELVRAGTITQDEGLSIAKSLGLAPWQKLPFASHSLAYARANAKRCMDRIAFIQRKAKADEATAQAGGVLVSRSESSPYVSVRFSEYPGRAIVASLKAAGFHWSGDSWHGNGERLPQSVLDAEAAAKAEGVSK